MRKAAHRQRQGSRLKRAGALTLCLLMLAFAACQPTPEDDFIRSKGDGLLQSAIKAPAEATVQPDFPTSLVKDIVIRENKLSLRIDVELKLPQTEFYPVVKVIPQQVRLEEVERVLSYFLASYYVGTPLLDGSCFEGLTGQEILDELEYNQWKIDHMSEIFPDSQEAQEEQAAILRERNKQLTEAYATAPVMPTIVELTSLGEVEGYQTVYVYADNNTRQGKLSYAVGNSRNDARGSTVLIYMLADEQFLPVDTPVFDSIDTFITFADQLITQIAPEQSYALNQTIEYEEYLVCYYMPIYEGVPHVRTTGYEGAAEEGESYGGGEFSFYWPDDLILITADRGMNRLRGFQRNSPTIATEVLNKNVQLLDFDIIEQSFENYIAANYSWSEHTRILSQTIVIDDIGLGMKRVPMPDGAGYMVIPAWYFAGYAISRYDPANSPYTDLDENGERVEEVGTKGVVAIINAVDGTVLN